MNKKNICKHRILAGFLTFLMFFTVFFSGIFISLRFGALHGGSIQEILKASKLENMIDELCYEMIDEEINSTEFAWIAEKEQYTEIRNELVDILIGAMFEKQENIELGHIIDLIIDAVEDEGDDIVDNVFAEIENIGPDFDAKENEYVQEIVNQYGLEVDDEFYAELNKYAKETENLEEYKDEIEAEVQANVIEPVKNDKDKYTEDLEKAFDEALNEYYASEGFATVEKVNDILAKAYLVLTTIVIGCVAASVILMIIIFLLYKNGIYGAFSKVSVVMGISGILLLLIGVFKFLVEGLVGTVLNEEPPAVGTGVMSLIDAIFIPFMVTGAVYMGIMIATAITKSILKRKYYELEQVEEVGTEDTGIC